MRPCTYLLTYLLIHYYQCFGDGLWSGFLTFSEWFVFRSTVPLVSPKINVLHEYQYYFTAASRDLRCYCRPLVIVVKGWISNFLLLPVMNVYSAARRPMWHNEHDPWPGRDHKVHNDPRVMSMLASLKVGQFAWKVAYTFLTVNSLGRSFYYTSARCQIP